MNKLSAIGLLVISSVINAGTLTVNNAANFTGTGSLLGDLVVETGGNVAPSSGCLSVNNASFSAGSNLSITLAGTNECVNYSQLQVNGTADLGMANLTVVTDNYALQVNDDFIILANDSNDNIINTFVQLPEDEIFILDGKNMYMSYLTGDGNDAGFTFEERYNVGGSVFGLANSNSVTLQNNGTDDITMPAVGDFTFSDQNDGSNYAVTISNSTLTAPDQSCDVTGGNSGNNNGTGTISGSHDASIQVTCTTTQYTIGGTVFGLINGNQVVLGLSNGDMVSVSNGLYDFTAIDDTETGFNYIVSVITDPSSPAQTCLISNPTGIMHGSNISNVNVNCSDAQYLVGGSVTGLAPGNDLTLTLGAENLVVTGSSFVFVNTLDDLTGYNVNVAIDPTSPNQTCTIMNGVGAIAGTDVDDIEVTCTSNAYFIGGNVTGLLIGNFVELQNNTGDNKPIFNNGVFVFNTPITDEEPYNVEIITEAIDPIQPCSVEFGSSVVAGEDVIDVELNCLLGDDLIYRHGFEDGPPNT